MGLTPVVRGQAQQSSLSGERRQVTALFYDIVGSVELLGRLDPEEFATIQRAFHNQAAAAIHGFGGRIDQIRGDGGCAYFGLPIPLEDAAECAIGAGLEIVERCIALQREQGSVVMVRIGVATGMVVIAATAGTALPGQDEIIGMAPALAARIQAEAEPNSVVIAESTYRLAQGAFEFASLGARQLKGFSEPIELWQPLARRAHIDRFSGSRRVAAPLIGREDELSLCRQAWQQALAGEGQFLLLHGEAGIGKSRLVAELRGELEAGADIAVFQCQPRGNTRPLHPFLDALEREIAATGAATIEADDVRAHFRAQGASIDDTDAEAIAFLCENRKDDPVASWPSDLSADEVRARGQDAMLHVLSRWPRPRLIVIEDFHWADSLTGAVVERLPEAIRDRPILVVVTDRDSVSPERLNGPNVASVALSRLGAGATSRLLDSIWEDAPPEGLAAFIHERSDGVPLFAEQLACLLKETSSPQANGTDRRAPADWSRALPGGNVLTLQDLIAARLSGLGPLRRLAQVASAIGREFSLDLLARIMDPDLLPYRLDLAVRNLARAGIFTFVANGDTPAARFQHVLIQEAAYDSLLKADRRQLHQRIVGLVLSGVTPALSDALMAWHLEQAERPLDAAHYAIRAATACIARSAMQEADQLLNVAQRQLDGRDLKDQTVRDLQLELLAARGPLAAAMYGRGSPQAGAIYEQGVALCSAATGQDRARWLPLYWGWWFTAPNYEAQKARAEIVVRDLEETADAEVRLQSLHCAWATNFAAGRHAYCLHCVEAGLALYDEERARLSRVKYGGHDARVCGLGERALSLWFTGDDAGSARSIAEAVRWAERTAHFNSIFHALDYAVGLARYRGDHARVVELSDRMAVIAEEHALSGDRAKAKLFGGWGRALLGDAGQGMAHFAEGFALQREIGTEENLPIYRDMEAEILAHAGRHEEALAILEQAIAGSSRSGQVFWLPELYRHRGLLRLRLGQHADDCRADFERAIALAEAQDASALAARARADIDRLGQPPVSSSP